MEIKKSINRWFSGQKQELESLVQGPAIVKTSAPADVVIEPEILAAIGTVVAIEVKIFMASQGQQFTFKEGGQPHGWNESGRLLVRPYQGVS